MKKYLLEKLVVNAAKAGRDPDARLAEVIAAEYGISAQDVDYVILNASVDSRKAPPKLIYKLMVETPCALPLPEIGPDMLASLAPAALDLPESRLKNPIVIGTGPAGVFAALILARAGCCPVVIDRGNPVDFRKKAWDKFLADRQLDEDNNLLIGEGGAGAFSDGKLYTGTRDVNRRFILERMIAGGAPAEIAYQSRPHVGSDRLPLVSESLREEIIRLGGEFIFGCEVTGICRKNGRCTGIRCGSREISAPAVLLAPGLGGRELVRSLAREVECIMKPFQMGCRVEHPQQLIDRCQYHCGSRPAALGAAEYHMVSRPAGGVLGVSSFCMCPGGSVVNATAWKGHSISNGMSNYARNGEFANSCLIATLDSTYFTSPDEAYSVIESIEKKLFVMGGNDYTLPAQDIKAFLAGSCELKKRRTSCETGIVPGRIDELLLPEIRNALSEALCFFDRKCPGFIREGKVIGVESCVSSPLRFIRSAKGESSLPGLFLAGEGVGGAGGIMSGAADGIRCALQMLALQ